jgi:hypothetical protein
VTTSEITFARYQRAANQPQVAAHSNGTIKKSRATLESSEIVLTADGPDRDMLLKVSGAVFDMWGDGQFLLSNIFYGNRHAFQFDVL